MFKSRSLKRSKYRVGEWSKRNMKWTRAEDWAAWGRAKAEDAQNPLCDDREGIDKQGFTDNVLERADQQGSNDNVLDRADQQGSIDDGREWIDIGCDVQGVSEDASA